MQTLTDTNKVYYFDGCFSKFEDQVKKNKEVVIWATAGAALVMVRTNVLPISPHQNTFFSFYSLKDYISYLTRPLH